MKAAAQRKWITTIHVAKNRIGLDDDAYRAVLGGSAGVSSASEIKTWEQYNSVMAAFRKLGFRPQKPPVDPQDKRHPDWISEAQERYIRGLWNLVSHNRTDRSLDAMVKRITGAETISWLQKKNAGKVILALRQMAAAKGFNPDRKL